MAKGKKAKFKLPKRIAGIKIPKMLRKSSGSLTEFLATPLGREIAAGALIAIAGSLTGRDRIKKAASSVGEQAAQAGSAGSTVVRDVAEVAVGAITEAAKHALPALAGGKKRAAPSDNRKEALASTSLSTHRDDGEPDRKRH